MKHTSPALRFDPPHAGWLGITVLFDGREIPVNTSSVFDPYPAFLKWLEKLAADDLPCKWYISEEDSFMEFTVYPAGAKRGRLVLRGTRERDGAPDDVRDICEFFDTPVDTQALARSFYQAFRRYLKNGFVSNQWSSNLCQMDFSRLETLLTGEGG